jgi:OmpA-OmpF porin, OOP family
MRMLFVIPALAILATPVAAAAEELTTDAIVCALDPSCAKPATPPGIEGRKSRGINTTGGTIAQQPANSINLTVNFEYDSAILQTDARINLDKLGAALTAPQLAGYNFSIGGHTDARGRPGYNLALSERRAKAVRDYLVTHFGIPAGRLTAQGYGSTKLLLPDDPENGANRRVQIVNQTASSQ